MRPAGWITLLIATSLLSGVAGWQIGRTPHSTGTPDTQPPSVAETPAVTADSGDLPINDTDAPQVRRARSDPAYLSTLLGRYASESEVDSKGALLAVLGAVANDEVMRFGLRQLASEDPAARRDGLALLQAFPPDEPTVRSAVLDQLANERDPRVQAKLMELLQPAGMPREDAVPVLSRLNELVRSEDPEVRAASLTQLAQWDDSPAVEAAVQQALVDADPQVRQAAIGSVGAAHLRSGPIKDTLLDIAMDPARDASERQDAALMLQQFRLDRADHALLAQAVHGLPDHDGGDGHDHP